MKIKRYDIDKMSVVDETTIGFIEMCKSSDVSALESEIERLKKDKERIITLTVQWKKKACERYNHEILPMRYEIERLKAEHEAQWDKMIDLLQMELGFHNGLYHKLLRIKEN